LEILEKFHQVVSNRHEYAQEWKTRTQGKVVGCFCSYVPEEILYASGTLPVRIMGGHESPSISDTNIFNMYCPFCRDCLAQGLKGKYHYLDGIVTAHSCIHIRQAFDSWQRHLPISYSHYIFMPAHVQNPHANTCLVGELEGFKHSLEEWTGQVISPQALDDSIKVYNTNRRLMKNIYELRKKEPPPISGADTMEMVLSSMFMDKEEHNQWLKSALDELSKLEINDKPKTRLMLVGGANDDIEFSKLVESLDARIVIDDHCTGTRYFWNEVSPENDELSAIANRYINKPPCPHKDLVERRRFAHLLNLASDYRVQGVIMILQKFCDPHEFDAPPIQSIFREAGIPVLSLESDVTIPVGQFQTRVEAFLEMIQFEI